MSIKWMNGYLELLPGSETSNPAIVFDDGINRDVIIVFKDGYIHRPASDDSVNYETNDHGQILLAGEARGEGK